MRKPAYYPAFDWLRITLAMTVALFHSGLPIGADGADFAVQIFFALSGLLIGGILMGSHRRELPRFFYNRAVRIWTPYFFSVILVFAASLLVERADAHWFEFLFYDLTFTHNWFISTRIAEVNDEMPLFGATVIYWSLSVEEQFYLIAPLLILFWRRGRSPVYWFAIAAFAVASGSFYGAVALGVFAAAMKRQYGDWHLKGAMPYCFAAGLGACIVLYANDPALYRYLAPPAAFFIVLLLARAGKRQKLGAFFGGVSYPLYLNHWAGVLVAKSVSVESSAYAGAVALGVSAIVNIVIAAGLYQAIDVQVRRRRERLYSPTRGIAAAVAAYGLVSIGVLGGLVLMVAR